MRMSISKKAYIKIRELGLIPGSLFRIQLFCYIFNPLKYVFFVVANCTPIPSQLRRNINLSPLIDNTSLGN